MASTTLLSVRSVSDWLYAFGLSSAFRSPYTFEPSFALSRDADIWELVRNDLTIDGAIDRSNKSIVRPWRIEAFDGSKDKPDKQIAAVLKDGLGQIELFNVRRRRLAEARFLGRTYAAILWTRRRLSLGGLPEMDWWVPYHLQDIDRRRFHWATDWDQTHRIKVGIHLEMYNTNSGQWERLAPHLEGSLIQVVVNDTEDRVGYGRGILECVYVGHYMKTVTFEKISQGIDRWANGIVTLKLDSLRGASTDKTNEDLRLAAENLVEQIRSEHGAVLQDGDELTVIESSGTGHQMSMEFLRYLDESIERRVNGSVRPFGHSMGQTGSRAASQEEGDQSETFYQDEREHQDEVLNRDLVGGFMRVNAPALEKAGLAKARRPRFTSEQIRRQDPETSVRVMNEMGKYVELSRREYYEKGEMTDPKGTGEEIIGPFATPGMDGDADWGDMGIGGGKNGGDKPRKTYSHSSSRPGDDDDGKKDFARFEAGMASRMDGLERLVREAVRPAPPPPSVPSESHTHIEQPITLHLPAPVNEIKVASEERLEAKAKELTAAMDAKKAELEDAAEKKSAGLLSWVTGLLRKTRK